MNERGVGTKVLLKSVFWYTASSFLTRAMVFFTMPFFTRILTNDQYGDFSVFTSWQGTLMIICGLETYSTINRARFDFTGEGELDGYISSSLCLSILFTTCLFFTYLMFPALFDRFFLVDRRYMWVMFAYFYTFPAFSMFHAKQRIEYKYKLSSFIAFAVLVLSYILAIGLTVYMENDRLWGRILGQYILYIICGLLLLFYYFYVSRNISFRFWKYALHMGVPLVFAYLGNQILLSSDSIVVKHMCSAELVSYLSVTHSCSQIILLLVRAINTAWAPWFYDMLNKGQKELIRKVYQVYLWIAMVLTLGVVIIGPEIVDILGGDKYQEAKYLFPAYTVCGIFTIFTTQFANLETYHKKTGYTAVFSGIAAIVNIVLNILGVKLWGYWAVCYVTLFCQLLLIGLHYFFTLKLGIREFVPFKNLLLTIVISLFFVPVALVLYRNDMYRYSAIALLALFFSGYIVIRRETFKDLFMKFKRMD